MISPEPDSNSTDISDFWCQNKIHITNYSFVWTIEGFSFHQEPTGTPLESAPFPNKGDNPVKWYLHIYPNGNIPDSKEYLSIFVKPSSANKSDIKSKIKVSLLNCKKEAFKKREDFHIFPHDTDWGWGYFIEKDVLFNKDNDLLPKDKLTIKCEIELVSEFVISGPDVIKVPECSWSKDMGFLLENPKFSDVILNVCGHKFHCHKNILTARSEVFAAMFEHEMEENKQNNVDIVDFEPEVMQEMIRYIYTGRAPNLTNIANKLLVAADKYALERLKVMCEEALSSSLTVETAAEILSLANMHNALQLKSFTIKFINANFLDVIRTEAWKSNVSQQPSLAVEVIDALASITVPAIPDVNPNYNLTLPILDVVDVDADE